RPLLFHWARTPLIWLREASIYKILQTLVLVPLNIGSPGENGRPGRHNVEHQPEANSQVKRIVDTILTTMTVATSKRNYYLIQIRRVRCPKRHHSPLGGNWWEESSNPR